MLAALSSLLRPKDERGGAGSASQAVDAKRRSMSRASEANEDKDQEEIVGDALEAISLF